MYKIMKYNNHILIQTVLNMLVTRTCDKLKLVTSNSNRMFGRVIQDKLPECISESFEIAQVKQGQFQNFQESRGCNVDYS